MQIRQLEADLVELGSLLEKAERKRMQDLLKQEKQKVEKELALKKQQKEQQVKREADPSAPSKAPYTVKITNYGMLALFGSSSVHLCKSATVLFVFFFFTYNFTYYYLFDSMGPVREICQDLHNTEGCPKKSIRKCRSRI